MAAAMRVAILLLLLVPIAAALPDPPGYWEVWSLYMGGYLYMVTPDHIKIIHGDSQMADIPLKPSCW